MNIVESPLLTVEEKESVLRLWNNGYPEKLKQGSLEDLETYFNGLQHLKHYLLRDETHKIVGWCFSFERTAEKWFAIILDGSVKNKGYGTQLLNVLKNENTILNGWVIDHDRDLKCDGTYYRSPLNFYLKNKFAVIPAVRLDTEKISAVKIEWRTINY